MSEPSGTDDKAQVAKLERSLEAVRQEAAKYRIARNGALRSTHALKAVLSAHQITFDINNADTGGLLIEDGAVQGEFSYTPPTPAAPTPAPPAGTPTEALTKADVRTMSADAIASNWDAVMSAMASG